jgi:hypothetical protein
MKNHTSNYEIKSYQATLEFTMAVAASTFLNITLPVGLFEFLTVIRMYNLFTGLLYNLLIEKGFVVGG